MKLFHKIFTAALLSSAALPGAAMAADAPPAVQAFLANLERQTATKPSYDAVKDDGNGNVTLTNLTLAKPAQGDNPSLTVKAGEANFSGITEEGPALWQIGKASFANTSLEISSKEGSFKASFPASSAEGWYVHQLGANPTPQEEMLSSATYARKMSSGPVSITADGQTFSIDGVETTWDGDPKTGAGKFSLKVNNVAIPEALVALMDQGGMLKQLGYPTLNFDVTSDADVAVKGESLSYDFNLALAGRNIGSLRVGATIDEIPVALYTALMKPQADGKEVDLSAYMPQMQNALVKGASIRFEDSSIVKKILPIAAAIQGMDEKTLVASIPPMLQLTLVQFQNEAFTKQAVDAVTRFLSEPKSFTISATPAAPLKVSDFNSMDPAKPGEAISKMGLEVKAND